MEPGDDEAETRGARRRQARKGNGGVAGGAPPQSCGLCRGPRPRNRATAERRFAPDRSDVGAVHGGRSRLRESSEGTEWSGLVDGRQRTAGRQGSHDREKATEGRIVGFRCPDDREGQRSEEHTSELQSLMRSSYAV